MSNSDIIAFEAGWSEIKKAIDVLQDMLQNGLPPGKKSLFTLAEYSAVYT
jgi:pentatricopeptide repeat protein